MESNFEYNFDDENINDDGSENASYIGFPYPIKVSKYDRPHVIELTFPLKRVNYFINRIMLFKLFINKNTTNKEAYNLLLKLSKENSLVNKNTASLFDNMIYNTIKKKMYLYDDDKLLLDKDNSYLDYILSTFISMTIDTGVGDFEHNSKVVPKDELGLFKDFFDKSCLFMLNVYLMTLKAMFTNDYEGDIVVDDFIDNYKLDSYNMLTFQEMKDIMEGTYDKLKSITEINMLMIHNVYANIMREFTLYLYNDIYKNENKNQYQYYIYDNLSENKSGKEIFELFDGAEINDNMFEEFTDIVLNYKECNLCKEISDFVRTIPSRSNILN